MHSGEADRWPDGRSEFTDSSGPAGGEISIQKDLGNRDNKLHPVCWIDRYRLKDFQPREDGPKFLAVRGFSGELVTKRMTHAQTARFGLAQYRIKRWKR
jgi:hypothetical protein